MWVIKIAKTSNYLSKEIFRETVNLSAFRQWSFMYALEVKR